MEHIPIQPGVEAANNREAFGDLSSKARHHDTSSGLPDAFSEPSEPYRGNPLNILSTEEARIILERMRRVGREADEVLREAAQRDSETPDDDLPDPDLFL